MRQAPLRRITQAGFTLLETLLVFAILALMAAALAPNILPSSGTRLRGEAGELAAALRQTRQQAIARQQPAVLLVDTEQHSYHLDGSTAVHHFDPDTQIRLTTAESELTGSRIGGLRFYPDGTSTGGRVSLTGPTLTLHVDIAWLTGRVRVLDTDTP